MADDNNHCDQGRDQAEALESLNFIDDINAARDADGLAPLGDDD